MRLTPTAWAKLVYLRDYGPTEVGGFGITTSDHLLQIDDVMLVRQRCTETFVAFDDESVAEFFENQIDAHLRPEQFARIWIHTHPADSAEPSPTDHETFERVFGHCDWAVMLILARNDSTHAELHWRQEGPVRLPMDVLVDSGEPFPESDFAAWEEEYVASVQRLSTHSLDLDDSLDAKSHSLHNPFEPPCPDITPPSQTHPDTP